MKTTQSRHIDPKETIQRRLAGKEKPHWELALICFRPYQDSQNIITKLNAEPLGYSLFSVEEFPNAPRIYQATINDVGIVILRGHILGGPHTASILEELVAVGIETIVGQGIAGSVDKSIRIGNQVIAAKALNTDGTSKYYINSQQEVLPDEKLAELVRQSGVDLGTEMKAVTAATVDAFYQETDEMIKKWQIQGAQILNMEVTPVYAIAQYYSIRAIWLGYISDSIFSQSNFQYGNEVRELSDLICLSALRRLSIYRCS